MKEFRYSVSTHTTPVGAVDDKSYITYTFEVAQNVYASKVFFVFNPDGLFKSHKIEMKFMGFCGGYKQYQVSVKYPSVGLFWYHFIVEGKNSVLVQKKGDLDDIEIAQKSTNGFPQIVADDANLSKRKPSGGIIYHIFVDRFNRVGKVKSRDGMILKDNWNEPLIDTTDYKIINKECYGGNIKGITEKLNYLKSLNVSIIYLSPIFYAESNHKYNTADFKKIDPMFGTKKDLQELIDKAKELDIQIILDGVFNHVGSDSVYFNKYGKFDEIGAYQSADSKYYNWFNFYEYPDNYECWWDIKSLPCINEANPEYKELICGKDGVIESYMKMGLGGFRLDVVDELGDDLLNSICKKIYKCKKDALIVGEVWEDASTKISYGNRRKYFLGEQLNSVTNYPLKNAILHYIKTGDASEYFNTFKMVEQRYPFFVQNNLMNIVGTHDTSRLTNEILSINKDRAFELTKIASLLQYIFIGIPTVFYGDEVGLLNIKDGNSRAPYPWGSENNELLNWYKMLGELRSHPALISGNLAVESPESGVLIVKRNKGRDSVIALTNLGEKPYVLETEKKYKVFKGNSNQKANVFEISPYECIILANK